MSYRKNVRRIDPRYFLNETVDRNEDGSALEEGAMIPADEYAEEFGISPRLAHRAKVWVKFRLKELGDLDAVLDLAKKELPSVEEGGHTLYAIQQRVEELRGGELEEGFGTALRGLAGAGKAAVGKLAGHGAAAGEVQQKKQIERLVADMLKTAGPKLTAQALQRVLAPIQAQVKKKEEEF